MAIWLPGDSDFATAWREPNLLVPGKKPVGPLAVKSGYDVPLAFLFQGDLQQVNSNYPFATYAGTPKFTGEYIDNSGHDFGYRSAVPAGAFGLLSKPCVLFIDHVWSAETVSGWGMLYEEYGTSINWRARVYIHEDDIYFESYNAVTATRRVQKLAYCIGQRETLAFKRSPDGSLYILNKSGVLASSASQANWNDYLTATVSLFQSIQIPSYFGYGLTSSLFFLNGDVGISKIQSICGDHYNTVFEPANSTPYLFPVAVGGGAVTGTGDLVGSGSEITGEGTRTVSGSGDLVAQGSAIVGTGARVITGTGALVGTGSDVTGSGATGEVHTGAGDLIGQGSQITGAGIRTVKGAGALVAQGSQITGAGIRTITGSGDLVGAGSEITGAGAAGGVTTGTGDLVGSGSQIVGVGVRTITGTGDLIAQGSIIAGVGIRTITGTGALVGQGSQITGTGQEPDIATGTGALTGAGSQIVGTGKRIITGAADLVAAGSIIVGIGVRAVTGSGALVGAGSAITGSSAHEFVADNGRVWKLAPRGRVWTIGGNC